MIDSTLGPFLINSLKNPGGHVTHNLVELIHVLWGSILSVDVQKKCDDTFYDICIKCNVILVFTVIQVGMWIMVYPALHVWPYDINRWLTWA